MGTDRGYRYYCFFIITDKQYFSSALVLNRQRLRLWNFGQQAGKCGPGLAPWNRIQKPTGDYRKRTAEKNNGRARGGAQECSPIHFMRAVSQFLSP